MLGESDFITVGSCQVSLECMVRLADIQALQRLAGRVGSWSNVQQVLEVITAIQQGTSAAPGKTGPAPTAVQCVVSLADLHLLRELSERLGGLAAAKVLVDLLAGAPLTPSPGPVDLARAPRRAAEVANGR